MKDFFIDGVRTSDGEILPFSLHIIVGKNEHAEEIQVTLLSKEKAHFSKHLYELEEFRPIIIQARVPPKERLYMFWDVMIDDRSEDVPILFTEHVTTACVYDQNHSVEGYPWSCGIYAFYVRYADQNYWGAFQVLPKNLTSQQLLSLHQLIENEVEDLAFEHLEHPFILEGEIFHLKEKYSQLRHRISYEMQAIYFSKNLEEITRLRQFLDEIAAFLSKIQHSIHQTSNEQEMLSMQEIEDELLRAVYQMKHSLLYINPKILPHRFSNQKMDWNVEGKGRRQRKQIEPDSTKRKILKPTFLLYEYYCFFFMLHILRELGYIPEEMDEISKQRLFSSNQEQFSAVIHMERNQIQLDLIYNAVIEPLVYQDFPDREGLFSLVDKRKPDIRLDLFHIESGKKIFLSTLILEVKYSPIFNIYQKKMKTKVMEQLKKYRSIVYQHKNRRGRGYYNRSPVYEVVCFYPGHDKLPIVLDTPIAIYMQNYPQKFKEGEIQMVGKQQMMQLLKTWIQEKTKRI